jgi:hypothetical protein
VRVAGDHVDEALGRQPEQPAVLHVGGGGLDQRALPHRLGEPERQIRGRVPLRVGDQAAEASLPEAAHRGRERARQGSRARLEQDPPAAPAERDGTQLVVGEAFDDGLGELTDAHVVVVADVGRRAGQRDPVGVRLPRHRDAVGKVQRAVVDAGEDVAVQVDHGDP